MRGNRDARLTALGVILLIVGFCGHAYAAHSLGSNHHAWQYHMFGFLGLTIVSAAIVGALGWKFWKGRTDITILIVGVIQLILGIMVALNPA
jgi:uncharacterized membrane protein